MRVISSPQSSARSVCNELFLLLAPARRTTTETKEREYRQRGHETYRRNAGERNASSSRLPRFRAPDPSESGDHACDDVSEGENREEHDDQEIAERFSDDESGGGGEGHDDVSSVDSSAHAFKYRFLNRAASFGSKASILHANKLSAKSASFTRRAIPFSFTRRMYDA